MASITAFSQERVCTIENNTVTLNPKFSTDNYITVNGTASELISDHIYETKTVIDSFGYKYTITLFGNPRNENAYTFDGIKIEFTGFFNAENYIDLNFETGQRLYIYNADGWRTKQYEDEDNLDFKFSNQVSTDFVKLDLKSSSILIFREPNYDVSAAKICIVLLHNGQAKLIYSGYTQIFDCRETTDGYMFKMAKDDMYNFDGELNPKFVSMWISKTNNEIWYKDSYPY